MADSNPSDASGGNPPPADDFDPDAAFAEYAAKIDRDPPASGSQPIEEPLDLADEPPVSTAPAEPGGPEMPAGDADAPSAESAAPDIWANATPEQLAALEETRSTAEKAKLDMRANADRVRGYERTVQDLRRENEELTKKLKASTSTETSLLESDEIKALEAEYGDVAGPLLKVIKAQEARINELTGTVETSRADAFISDQQALLDRDHPDWGDLVRNPGFKDWKEAQPLFVQRMIERNANAIVDAEEAGDALSRFRDHLRASAEPSPEPTPTPTPPEPRPDERRQRQMAGGADIRTKAPPLTAVDVEDPDQLFAQFANKIEAKARR